MLYNATRSTWIKFVVIGTFTFISLLWLYRFTGAFIPTTVKISGLWNIDEDQSADTGDEPTPDSTASKPVEILESTKSVILGKTKREDATWVKRKLPHWRSVIYSMDELESTEYHHVSINKGNEAMAYLTYLIDYYDDLSDVNVFIHAHEEGYPHAWHNEFPNSNYSMVNMLQRVRIDNVHKNGYVNLRCNGNPGCNPKQPRPFNTDSKEDILGRAFGKLWEHMYGNTSFPNDVRVPCCAQFAVSRSRIREQPREFYERAREWIVGTDEEDPGRPMEYFWHIMFGMPPVL
ncbi:hypothetical protein TWF696_000159 [Orbilia brochopaga]|uniref:Uncharacterized protein n=1 Tax=Orbilia brochopaga TaxID=3140254 RepID=A0AAV9VE26_9PEZI